MNKSYFLLLALNYITVPLLGQDTPALMEERRQQVISHYEDQSPAPLLSGKMYHPDLRNTINHPYFGEEEMDKGTLGYGEVVYREVDMQYDLHAQQLVVQLDSRYDTQPVIIDLDKLSYFEIHDGYFVHLPSDGVMEDGIYQLIYRGPQSSLYAYRYMDRDVEATHTDVTVEFKPRNRFYIENERGTYLVSNRKSFLAAYPDAKAVLKEENVRFSKSFIESGLVAAMSKLDPQSSDQP